MSDGVTLTFENKEFTRAIQQYEEASGKELAQILDDKGKDVCFFSAREIESGDPSREHPKGSIIYHALASSGGTRFGTAVKGQGNKKLADKIYNRRRRSKGYSRAIFVKMAGDLGARLTVKAGKIRYAGADKAKPGIKPFVLLRVDGLEKTHVENVLQPAIDRALPKVAADMNKYTQRKLSAIAKKHSGKGRRR